MMNRRLFAPLVLIASLMISTPLISDETKPADKPAADKGAEKEKPPEPPAKFVRQHRLKVGGSEIAYTTTAEEIILKDGEGKSTARFFTIAYTKDGVTNSETRPVTFVFNGGPGSASIWLHFGLVGPKLIDIPSDAQDPGAPPYKLRDNPGSIFRATDLVFIDPVGTGYSRAAGDKKDEDFWGYEEDADSVAEFIRTFITQHNRWNSPKYILGESYGGIRSALLVPRLQGNFGVGLNGVILLSRLPDQWKDLDTLLREVEHFAGSEYLLALFQGDRLDKAEKERLADKLHRYIGLSKEYLIRSNLRVTSFRFAKELLRDQGKTLGLLDGRYSQDEIDNVSDQSNNDPFNAKTGPVYVSSFQSYLKNDLGVDFEKRYVGTSDKAGNKWKRPAAGRNAFAGFVDVTGALAQGTKDNEALRVFAAAGYNDLVTSYFALNYMLGHSGIDPARLTIHDYPGGHMMYLHRPSADALSNDIVKFIEAGAGAAQ